jgi:deazaflavin-dependent oxidoreductase (nitroreductase family)
MADLRRAFFGIGKTKFYATLGRALAPMDTMLLRASRGRLGVGVTVGLRTLLLTTVGKRSGQPRQVPLVFLRQRDGFLVVGSNWGGEHHPAWTVNLVAQPEATATVAGTTIPVRGKLLSGAERAEAWEAIITYWPAYATYAERADHREIRVFRLEPR